MLTKQGVEADELVKRTQHDREELGDYFIFEIDKNPVACVALHVYPEQNQGELACLYVSSSHENQGIGRKLIQFVENKARELGLRELLALSTQAVHLLQSKGGFVEGTPDDLPPARREKYETERPQFQGAGEALAVAAPGYEDVPGVSRARARILFPDPVAGLAVLADLPAVGGGLGKH